MSAALDELIAGCDMSPRRKVLPLPNGTEFIFWASPVTLEERARARKEARNDDAVEFALILMIAKATYEDGRKRFDNSDLPGLKRVVPAAVAEDLLQKLLSEDDDRDDAIEVISAPMTNGNGPKPSRERSLATAS